MRNQLLINPEAYKALMALSPIGHRLFLFMAVKMDLSNIQDLTFESKQEFIADMQECGKRISMQSIHNAINELKKLGLINEVSRATYRVSRKLYSKVSGATE